MTNRDHIEASEIDWHDLPMVRKVGRYVFFAFLAFSASIPIYALGRAIGIDKPPCQMLGNIGAIIVFVALRDMSKQWDWVLHTQAELRASRRTGGQK